MSSSDSNIIFKKTSFLSGINSEFINQLYSDFLIDPKLNTLDENLNKSVEKALKVRREDCRNFALKLTWEDCASEFLESQIDAHSGSLIT